MCASSKLELFMIEELKGTKKMRSQKTRMSVVSRSKWIAALMVFMLSGTALLSGCFGTKENPVPTPNDGRLKVGFITVGPASDWGYNYAHNQGRIFLEGSMPKDVQTTIVENIPESAEVERVMEKMIAS